MSDWRRTAKIISTTFLVTSAGWLIGGAILFAGLRHADNRAEPLPVANAGSASTAKLAPAVVATVEVPRLLIPVAGVSRAQLVDTFTQSREGGARAHNAIDILAPRGTPVIAAAAGTVEKLFVSGRGGNTIYVRSPPRTLIYYYAHLDAYAPGLAEGQTVTQGQVLGTVGSTGDASPDAPHLHFEIQQTGAAGGWWQHTASLNPYPYLRRQ
ncbi:M23 family metallopeptidase [Novosphingobium sp. Gsoil 351]|uniref:M23 family metallopeptidase n=1 Tax=Novosphingobium sp. Gsoil 351 TaxID=2675225 RepID=UPI0012B4B1A7|nr:M23 family metallopeptidase [Novosphingobium sp. Gsoil 351]QGN53419.1 peptidoglycan DD-metalloendopeptidase family protein [Novosphingobium sp. Gsoil 351]